MKWSTCYWSLYARYIRIKDDLLLVPLARGRYDPRYIFEQGLAIQLMEMFDLWKERGRPEDFNLSEADLRWWRQRCRRRIHPWPIALAY